MALGSAQDISATKPTYFVNYEKNLWRILWLAEKSEKVLTTGYAKLGQKVINC